jgi:rhamnosyl/mannosyltransferase
MKIFQVNKLYYPWIGGVEKVVQQIAEGLNGKNFFKIEVLCCLAQGRGKEEIINGVKVHQASSLGIFGGMPISFDFFRLFNKLSKKADIINFHHPFPLGDLAIFLFKSKVKLVVHYHSDIVRQKIFNFLINPLINHTLKKAEKIIVSNPNLVKNSPHLQKFQEKCEIIPFGVNPSEFEKYDEIAVKNLRKKYGNFVLFVGRLNYYKGVQYLIEAMRGIRASLIIIGEGKEKKNLEFRIKNLGLENKVFFLSLSGKELINYYRACSVFILPSIFKSEAFGIVLIEAMASGAPIISTELGTGTSWVNIHNETGFVVPAKNSFALFEAIKKILENKNLAEKFSQNAKKRVEEEFSLEKMLKKIESLYIFINEKKELS